jgi:hypothetical protein
MLTGFEVRENDHLKTVTLASISKHSYGLLACYTSTEKLSSERRKIIEKFHCQCRGREASSTFGTKICSQLKYKTEILGLSPGANYTDKSFAKIVIVLKFRLVY